MEQLNKVNQEYKLLKRTHKKEAQQNQIWVAKANQQILALVSNAKTPTKDTVTKPTTV